MRSIRAINYEIPDGDLGIYVTADYMWNYALRDTKELLVKRLVSSLRGMTSLDTIKNIYDWVWHNVRYKSDPKHYEMITAPIHYLNGNRDSGDCDCMTTLLVCLLESAGFDCSIVVIAWRKYEYTHVFCEVWYNNSWFILDPTLKANGFGRQDKEIIRYKRTTKKDMAKLQVLADSHRGLPSPFAAASKKYRHRCSCGNGELNKNLNNININFGTSVASSGNRDISREIQADIHRNNGGRALDNILVPRLDNIYNYRVPGRHIALPSSLILKQNSKGIYEEIDTDNSSLGKIVGEIGSSKRNLFLITKKGLLSNKRPNYVPLLERNYYQEFP